MVIHTQAFVCYGVPLDLRMYRSDAVKALQQRMEREREKVSATVLWDNMGEVAAFYFIPGTTHELCVTCERVRIFRIDGLDTSSADERLQQLCTQYGLQWSTPEFCVEGNYLESEQECGVRFYYGIPLVFKEQQESSPRQRWLPEHRAQSIDLARRLAVQLKDTPFYISGFGYWEEEEEEAEGDDPSFIIGVQFALVLQTAASTWDRLLQEASRKYDLPWKAPRYHQIEWGVF
ncbi:MAG: hypothetical protein EU536_01115 [Promethearchaeota archaeon]|nr:MAG: hypothetical protein EU536_01115 [Candidatus Lokiarchaeota archaeon]